MFWSEMLIKKNYENKIELVQDPAPVFTPLLFYGYRYIVGFIQGFVLINISDQKVMMLGRAKIGNASLEKEALIF